MKYTADFIFKKKTVLFFYLKIRVSLKISILEIFIELAQWFLGYLYEHKLNDKNKALKYYTLAGENGMIFAMEKVGIIYYQGEFVERNLQKAEEWFTKASLKKSPPALFF